ncbi:hypothetical protein [Flaviaesturariibacter aridisoli]|uniref:Uncharacterized protein n=1 Tax=Flaviaesturariibacter aridisoli TaxID=2545761 RepID=A0A4V2WMH8_9BACT|nr:hypothetical protein [Flaviaesturariibacter aridisoli]TCZ69324.1 hypothetical protein E0486_12475 [Flaviaesturariibacter aridisoli]
MATITNPTNSYVRQTVPTNFTATTRASMLSRFLNWCAGQEQFRFGWVAAIIAIHGCVVTPLTLFAIILSGSNIALWVTAIAAMGASLVTNLAAQPTKLTLPVFFATILVDIAIVVVCLVHGFSIAGTYI